MYRFKDFRIWDFGGVSGEPYFDNTRLLDFFEDLLKPWGRLMQILRPLPA